MSQRRRSLCIALWHGLRSMRCVPRCPCQCEVNVLPDQSVQPAEDVDVAAERAAVAAGQRAGSSVGPCSEAVCCPTGQETPYRLTEVPGCAGPLTTLQWSALELGLLRLSHCYLISLRRAGAAGGHRKELRPGPAAGARARRAGPVAGRAGERGIGEPGDVGGSTGCEGSRASSDGRTVCVRARWLGSRGHCREGCFMRGKCLPTRPVTPSLPVASSSAPSMPCSEASASVCWA
jgi:hypothetical protein